MAYQERGSYDESSRSAGCRSRPWTRRAEHPAPCATDDCEHDADYYVLTDDVLSEYVCEQHRERTVERAQA